MSTFKGIARVYSIAGRISVWRARKGGGGAVDVGDQALIRGLITAFPIMRPRHSLSYCGRRSYLPQSVRREFLYRCPAPTPAHRWTAVLGWSLTAPAPPSRSPRRNPPTPALWP